MEHSMFNKSFGALLPAFALLIAANALPAEIPLQREHDLSLRESQGARVEAARSHLLARRFELGLDALHGFQLRSAHTDELGQTHGRFLQTYQGVPVWGGDAVTHTDRDGSQRAPTTDIYSGIYLNVQPSLPAEEALAAAHDRLRPEGPYAHEPTVTLVVLPETVEVLRRRILLRDSSEPMASEIQREVVRYTLAWHVHTELENDAQETRHTDFLIQAHTGAILKEWNTLHTAGAAVGTGKSQWYGSVALNTYFTGSTYQLQDTTRPASGGNSTFNMNNKTGGKGNLYSDADNAWGDGQWYSGTSISTTSATGQTAAVDAHRGLQSTWDFYRSVFGRNGINGAGKATFSRVHYGRGYDNAFWSDSCFCMTYGDGNSSGSHGEADLDTCGHEMTHGVCSATANLTYSGESGGLNEATSDILGTMVEFWTLGGASGSTIPNSAGSSTANGGKFANYKLFENSWAHAYPNEALRWMHKPSRDGASPDFWSSTLGSLDVHYSSGVANHFFFLLAHGSQIDALSENEQSPMTNGVTGITGIGNDKAARIWYRALTTYMTSATKYAGARAATLSAAADLYGATSTEYATVALAWKAVNVQ
jgi:Zn-dependent metalloprotease